MNKKHLITCSVILVLVVISTLSKSIPASRKRAAKVNQISKFLASPDPVSDSVDDFSFADESLPIENPKVKQRIHLSLKRHSYKHIGSSVLQYKASKLFPIIEPILRAYGIPDDFKYIPLVESGLKSGTSIKGARGIWQFMPQTARDYGLKVNKSKDERLNVHKSTVAACKYIKELYAKFNSWTLAAAAYNGGSPRVMHAINRHNKGNYYQMHLNHETGSYLYKLIAMKEIINRPVKYGYKDIYASNFLKPSEVLTLN